MTKHSVLIAIAATTSFLTGFTTAAPAEKRFDQQILVDFFAGFAGNTDAMARAMKNTEAFLAVNPNHAEARVWHGVGLFGQSTQYFQSGDTTTGTDLFTRGQKEMDEAVALAPDNIAVRIPRGSALMAAGRGIAERNPEQAKAMLAKGLADYDHAYQRQKDELAIMGEHPAGELLLGIADTNSRLGNMERAAEFFDKINTVLPKSVYAKRAALWAQTKSLPAAQAGCIGCHTPAVK